MSELSSPNRTSPGLSDSLQFSYSPTFSLPDNLSPSETNRLLQIIPSLKQSLYEERSKFEYISNSLIKCDEEKRFLIAENESLVFRNEQLVKKVESLQESLRETKKIIDEKKKTFKFGLFGKNKRKGQLSNKASDDNTSLDPGLLEEELSFRVNENENLQRKIDILEHEIEQSQKLSNDRIKILEEKNQKLEKELNENLKEKEALRAKIKYSNKNIYQDNFSEKNIIDESYIDTSSSKKTHDSPLIINVIEEKIPSKSEEHLKELKTNNIENNCRELMDLFNFYGCGMIHLIVGPMFSGKSTELFRLTNRHILASKSVIIVKYEKDNRYEEELASTHDKRTMKAIGALHLKSILDKIKAYDVIGIDEGQFFDDVVEVCEFLANLGKIVIVAALDGDFQRRPFKNIINLYPLCEKIEKLSAVCRSCGGFASFTLRTISNSEIEVIGGEDIYKAVCRLCYLKFKNEFNTQQKEIKTFKEILNKERFNNEILFSPNDNENLDPAICT